MATAIGTPTSHSNVHSQAYVESILAQLDRLPTLSPVAMRLLQATTAEDTSARDLVAIIKGDASLTSALLRALHKADLGVRRDVTDIDRAVTLLGFTAVRNVVLTVSVFEALTGTDHSPAAVARRNALWTHNLAVACAAEMLAHASSNQPSPGDAFVCGLLHDVGKIALEACFPKSYARVIERVERHHGCLGQAERDVLGLDHTVAGKRLLAHWGVGQAVIECAWLHHEPIDALPPSVSNPDLVALIHLADGLVRQHGIGFSGYAGSMNLAQAAVDVGVSGETLTETVRHLPERMAPLAGVMGLDSASDVLSTEALLSANHQLGAINAELAESNRTLQKRAHTLTGLDQLIQEAGKACSLGALCAAAAQVLLEVLEGDYVVVVAFDENGSLLHVGSSCADRAEPRCRHVDDGQLCEWLKHKAGELFGDSAIMLPVSDGMQETLQSIDPLWDGAVESGRILPLMAGDDVAGIAAIRYPKRTARVATDHGGELEILLRAVGQTIHSQRAKESAQRMAEQLVELNRRFRQAQAETFRGKSVAMIAKMADGAAHELNNPLSVISGRAQLALKDCQDADVRKSLEIIVDQAGKAAGIATELMEFAKPDAPHPQPQPLAALLEPLCQHWREGFQLADDRLRLNLADPGATAFVDIEHFRLSLSAIIENAAQAAARPDHHIEINSPSRSSDESVRLVIRDNGSGMAGDVLEHAIDPFFSHRPAGRSRGLGLSRAHRLMELNGGRLWIESIPNLGTTVTIELPARAPGGSY